MTGNIQSGALGRRWTYGVETSWDTIALANSGKRLRRNSIVLNQVPDTYQSNEIRPSLQVADFRDGVLRVTGQAQHDWAPGEYPEWDESLLLSQYAAVSAIGTGPTITTTSTTIVRGTGSFITDNIKKGHVVRLSGTTGAINDGINLAVSNVTATTLTVTPTSSQTLTADGSGNTSTTITVIGTVLFSVTDPTLIQLQSLSIEDYQGTNDIALVYTGCYIGNTALTIPGTGIITAQRDITGRRQRDPYSNTTAPYFTTSAAPPDKDVLATSQGFLRVGSYSGLHLLSATINMNRPWTGQPAAFEQYLPGLFPGMLDVNGTLNFYMDGSITQLKSDVKNEVEMDVHFISEAPGTTTRRFRSFYAPRVKLGGVTANDVVDGITIAVPFKALELRSGANNINSCTVQIQDSDAT